MTSPSKEVESLPTRAAAIRGPLPAPSWQKRRGSRMSDPTTPPMPEPDAHRASWSDWEQYHDESDPLPDKWDDKPPSTIEPLFTASQMRSMYLQGWRDRGEVDAKACELEAAASSIGHGNKAVWQSQVAGRCAAAIRSIPEPKEGK